MSKAQQYDAALISCGLLAISCRITGIRRALRLNLARENRAMLQSEVDALDEVIKFVNDKMKVRKK